MATTVVPLNRMQRCGAGVLIPLVNLVMAQQLTEIAQYKCSIWQVWSVLTRDMNMHAYSNRIQRCGVGAITAMARWVMAQQQIEVVPCK